MNKVGGQEIYLSRLWNELGKFLTNLEKKVVYCHDIEVLGNVH